MRYTNNPTGTKDRAGHWCLRCTGLINARRLAFESLTGPERKRRIAQGYSDDLLLKQPAVMDLNMRAASLGMMLLRHLLQPFLLTPLPVTLAENLVTYNMKPVAGVRARNEACDICQVNPADVVDFGYMSARSR